MRKFITISMLLLCILSINAQMKGYPGINTLKELDDVNVSPANGEFLKYEAGKWIAGSSTGSDTSLVVSNDSILISIDTVYINKNVLLKELYVTNKIVIDSSFYGGAYYGGVNSADTFSIIDDGDTTYFSSDNPIKIGDSSIIVLTNGMVEFSTPQIKLHRLDTINVVDTNWHAVQFDTIINSETTFLDIAWEYPVAGSDSTKLVINKHGIYTVMGCLHFQNNTGGAFSTINVYLRVLINGNEARCLQREYSATSFFATAQQSLSYNGTIVAEIGDTLELEIKTLQTSTEFISSDRFDNQLSATMYLIYESEHR